LRVVAIGGGTGLSTLLKGLKRYGLPPGWLSHAPCPLPFQWLDVTAIVTVTDDGGSTGRLRREFGMQAPGDIRNCMVALSEDSDLLAQLFNYRFDAGRGLKGHSFGNLFLTAMTRITGDFADAVRLSSEVLSISGRIYPSTQANVRLRAHLQNGEVVDGESRISKSTSPIDRVELQPKQCAPLAGAIEAIRRADVITLGPGSLYTSVVPNLLVRGVASAIRKSRAIKACIVNLMWQPGETSGMTASDHIAAIHAHARQPFVDYAIVNTEPITAPQRRRYAEASARPVEVDTERLKQLGVKLLTYDLVAPGNKVRHDSVKLAEIVLQLAKKGRRLQLQPAAAESRRK